VRKSKSKVCGDLHVCKKRYPSIPVIPALTTGAPNQTNATKNTIPAITRGIRIIHGSFETKNPKKTIRIEILNPLTAMRCVSQELLKFVLSSSGMSSLAPKSIPPKKTLSFSGYIFLRASRRWVRSLSIEIKMPSFLSTMSTTER